MRLAVEPQVGGVQRLAATALGSRTTSYCAGRQRTGSRPAPPPWPPPGLGGGPVEVSQPDGGWPGRAVGRRVAAHHGPTWIPSSTASDVRAVADQHPLGRVARAGSLERARRHGASPAARHHEGRHHPRPAGRRGPCGGVVPVGHRRHGRWRREAGVVGVDRAQRGRGPARSTSAARASGSMRLVDTLATRPPTARVSDTRRTSSVTFWWMRLLAKRVSDEVPTGADQGLGPRPTSRSVRSHARRPPSAAEVRPASSTSAIGRTVANPRARFAPTR